MANSLSHTKWMCKYHIVFIPKYRRKVIYHKLRADIGSFWLFLHSYANGDVLFGKKSVPGGKVGREVLLI